MADASYPRIYRYGPLGLTLWSLGSVALALLGVAIVFVFGGLTFAPQYTKLLKPFSPDTIPSTYWVWFASGFVLVLCGLFALSSTWGKLVLYEDRLEYHGAFARRRIRFADIVETSGAKSQYGFFFVTLSLKGPGHRSVQICDYGKMDDVLADWLNSLPNAEAKQEQARNETLLANPAFGATEAAREKEVNRHIKAVNLLGFVVYGVSMWAFLYPRPYEVCIAVVSGVPLLITLMVFLSGGRWSLTNDAPTGRIAIGDSLYFPCIVLALRAILDRSTVDWVPPVIWAAVAALVIAALAAAAERHFNAKLAGIMVLLCMAYSWGILMQVNYWMDSAPPKITYLQVLDKHRSSGRTITYYVDLPPWEPSKQRNEYRVDRNLYIRTHKGDTVCAYLYPGALGWADYDISDCPPAKS